MKDQAKPIQHKTVRKGSYVKIINNSYKGKTGRKKKNKQTGKSLEEAAQKARPSTQKTV